MTHNLLWFAPNSEPALSRPDRSPIVLAVIGAIALALPLAGCGRKGSLDPPPGGYVLEPGTARTPTTRRGAPRTQEKAPEYDEDGRPIAPEGPKRSFPLDPLIK
jgi:predicted small lipoprotein YifL